MSDLRREEGEAEEGKEGEGEAEGGKAGEGEAEEGKGGEGEAEEGKEGEEKEERGISGSPPSTGLFSVLPINFLILSHTFSYSFIYLVPAKHAASEEYIRIFSVLSNSSNFITRYGNKTSSLSIAIDFINPSQSLFFTDLLNSLVKNNLL